MRIVILTERPFPHGMASTTRIVAYARGMKDAGSDVSVLCTNSTEIRGKRIQNTEVECNFEGTHFTYTPGTSTRSSSAFKRVIHYYSVLFRTRKVLRRMQEKANIDVLFMGLSNFWFTWSHARWSRKNIRANDSCLGQVLSGQCAPAGEY